MRRENTVVAQNVQMDSMFHKWLGGKNIRFYKCVKRPSNRRYRRRGMVLIWTAILIMVMILIVGLSLDAGKLVFNAQQLQVAADAAALAGALNVKIKQPEFTRQKASEMGFKNTAENLAVTLRTIPAQPATFPTTSKGAHDYTGYDIVVGRWVRYNQTFLPTLDAPNAVKVIARRNTALAEMGAPPFRFLWGPMVGVDTANGKKETIAFCNSSNGAGLIVLSPEPFQGLEMGANADINIDGGGIHVNSTAIGNNNSDGAWIHGIPLIDTGFLNVVGGITPPPDDSSWEAIFEEALEEGEVGGFPVMDYMDGIQHINDPVAAQMLANGELYVESYYAGEPEAGPGARLKLPELLDSQGGDIPTRYVIWNHSTNTYEYTNDPSLGVTVGYGRDPITGLIVNVAATATLEPGYYPHGMRLSTGDNITLAPNSEFGRDTFFIFGGGTDLDVGLHMNGGSLTGHGVTCCVTQNFDTGRSGVLRITGGIFDIDSPGDWVNQNSEIPDLSLVEGLNGIAIWQDPAMTPLPEAHLNGNGNFTISGTIYCPDPIHMTLEGDLGDTGNQILCGTANILGTAEISVNYDGRNAGNAPSHVCIVH